MTGDRHDYNLKDSVAFVFRNVSNSQPYRFHNLKIQDWNIFMSINAI